MFGQNYELRQRNAELEEKLEDRDRLIKGKDELIADLRFDMKEQERSHESKIKILEGEQALAIKEAVMVEQEKVAKVNEENAVLKKEVEILNKAFSNMGFDVKDMKSILDQLVKGIVAKNEIKLIKS